VDVVATQKLPALFVHVEVGVAVDRHVLGVDHADRDLDALFALIEGLAHAVVSLLGLTRAADEEVALVPPDAAPVIEGFADAPAAGLLVTIDAGGSSTVAAALGARELQASMRTAAPATRQAPASLRMIVGSSESSIDLLELHTQRQDVLAIVRLRVDTSAGLASRSAADPFEVPTEL
jgi:hypothetical protein